MSGGCPQGTQIGMILYILKINPISFPGEITIQVSDILHSIGIVTPLLPSYKTLPASLNSAKYMDDATLQEAVDLKSSLATKLARSGPLPWWESSGKFFQMKTLL